MTDNDKVDFLGWLKRLRDEANEWGDRLDPDRNGDSRFARYADRIAGIARDAAGEMEFGLKR